MFVKIEDFFNKMIRQFAAKTLEYKLDPILRYCTDKQRLHIIKYYLEGKSQDEIASNQGITQQAVEKSIKAGRYRLCLSKVLV